MLEHDPVLVNEVIEYLAIKTEGIYVDATFGRGGHSDEILKRLGNSGRLLIFDKDREAIRCAHVKYRDEKRISIQQGSFTMLKEAIINLNLVGKVDGILFDLGVSSPQLDDPLRGFSFLRDGPLDMRMDTGQQLTAKEWINQAQEHDIARILKEYGDERYARRIAAAIVRERNLKSIETTRQLAEIVAEAHPAWEKHKHPATRTFQAIRIFINNELAEIKEGLSQSLEVLKVGGRLLVISFHSLEDRIVKQFIQEQEKGTLPEKLPVLQSQLKTRLKRVGWGIRASEQELARNPRSRSAVLRVAEKLL